KSPKGGASKLLEWPIMRDDALASLSRASEAFRFSAAVAAFAQQLRGGDHLGDFGYGDITALANSARGKDAFGYRGEFVSLVNLARGLSTSEPVAQGVRD
ncbi:MAG: YfbK domain-containing protein, partial [Pseudomonadota bacterium]